MADSSCRMYMQYQFAIAKRVLDSIYLYCIGEKYSYGNREDLDRIASGVAFDQDLHCKMLIRSVISSMFMKRV